VRLAGGGSGVHDRAVPRGVTAKGKTISTKTPLSYVYRYIFAVFFFFFLHYNEVIQRKYIFKQDSPILVALLTPNTHSSTAILHTLR
jgi:hypothetical protein